MVSALLTKIGGLFEKDYLFASFLPALIFVSAVVSVLAYATGIDAVSSWIDSWTTLQKAVTGPAAGLFVVVVGYVLNGLRPFSTRLWSGNIRWWALGGFIWIGVQLQQRRFRALRNRAERISPWRAVFDRFRAAARAVWNPAFPDAPANEISELCRAIQRLKPELGPNRVEAQLQRFVTAYSRFNPNSLTSVYRALRARLDEEDERERMRIQGDTATLDRGFGALATVKATRLGNVIDSFNRYPFTRYRMETEVFWPRLQHVIAEDLSAHVGDQRILLDFSLTIASLAALYAALAVLVGPWVSFDPGLWLSTGAGAMGICIFSYFLAVSAAEQLGDLVRSSFDLFRLDLLKALGLERPQLVSAERSTWERMSQLVVYGELADDLALRPPDAH